MRWNDGHHAKQPAYSENRNSVSVSRESRRYDCHRNRTSSRAIDPSDAATPSTGMEIAPASGSPGSLIAQLPRGPFHYGESAD